MKFTSFVLFALAGLAMAQDSPETPPDGAVAPAGDATTTTAGGDTTATPTPESTPAAKEGGTEEKAAVSEVKAVAPKDGEPAGDATATPTVAVKAALPKGAYIILPATGTKDAYGPGQTHLISVAPENKLVFEPESIRPRAGDIVRFQFLTGEHPIASCNWELPCQDNGVWNSKAHPTKEENGIKYVDFFVVENTPIWFFSTAADECQKGMIFAMNPNDDSQLASYIERSKKYQKKTKRDELTRPSAPRMRRRTGGLGAQWGL